MDYELREAERLLKQSPTDYSYAQKYWNYCDRAGVLPSLEAVLIEILQNLELCWTSEFEKSCPIHEIGRCDRRNNAQFYHNVTFFNLLTQFIQQISNLNFTIYKTFQDSSSILYQNTDFGRGEHQDNTSVMRKDMAIRIKYYEKDDIFQKSIYKIKFNYTSTISELKYSITLFRTKIGYIIRIISQDIANSLNRGVVPSKVVVKYYLLYQFI